MLCVVLSRVSLLGMHRLRLSVEELPQAHKLLAYADGTSGASKIFGLLSTLIMVFHHCFINLMTDEISSLCEPCGATANRRSLVIHRR